VLVAIPGADGSVLRGLSQATNKSGNSLEKAAENLANLPAAFQNLLDHFSERTASAEILRQSGGPLSAKMTRRRQKGALPKPDGGGVKEGIFSFSNYVAVIGRTKRRPKRPPVTP